MIRVWPTTVKIPNATQNSFMFVDGGAAPRRCRLHRCGLQGTGAPPATASVHLLVAALRATGPQFAVCGVKHRELQGGASRARHGQQCRLLVAGPQ